MDIVGFGEHVKGEFVSGCLIAVVDGRKQYLHRNGQFTLKGREMYLVWEGGLEPPVAIANEETAPRRKPRKVVGDDHG
jgi:hypothetical protein